MKKCLIHLAAILLLTGCSIHENQSPDRQTIENTDAFSQSSEIVSSSYNNAYASINPQEITLLESMFESWPAPEDSITCLVLASDYVIAEVTSIDGCVNFSERTGEPIYPCTIGTLKVVRSYSENYLAGDEIPFARMGGILSFDQYLEGITESQRDKLLYLAWSIPIRNTFRL